MMNNRTLKGCVLLAACAVTASPALAGIPDSAITVAASNENGSGMWTLDLSNPMWGASVDENGNLMWRLSTWLANRGMESLEITDTETGEVIAACEEIFVRYIADPIVSTNFAVQAVGADTRFTISAGPLSFPTLNSPLARASASMTVTDFYIPGSIGASGVNVVGEQAGGGIVSATYNGFIGSGTVFTEMIDGSLFAPAPGGSDAQTEDVPGGGGYTTIVGPVNDISVGFDFTLSAWDLASGNATFEVIPAPGAAALLLGGGLLGARRRR